jgi:hypothetical protein
LHNDIGLVDPLGSTPQPAKWFNNEPAHPNDKNLKNNATFEASQVTG